MNADRPELDGRPTLTADRLWALLPLVLRTRDAQQHGELRELIDLFAEQLLALEEDAHQLHDDQFIETCADWVTPYIGDLIGYRALHGVTPAVASPRADVANTIAYRRRKGTALMLEELTKNVTGWPAHAVEFFERLATTQHMNHVRLHAPATPALRDGAVRQRITGRDAGAFDGVAHTPEMRRPDAERDRGGAPGRWGIPHIGLFAWRLEALALSQVDLVADPGDASGRRWRVNPLGADLALFRRARTEASIDQLAQPVNVPEPLDLRLLAAQVRTADRGTLPTAHTDDWGEDASLVLCDGNGLPLPISAPPLPKTPVVRVADLRDDPAHPGAWAHEADVGAGEIGIDPERGRVLLGSLHVAAHAATPYRASLHLGQARRFGGGEYERIPDGDTLLPQLTAGGAAAFQTQLDTLRPAGGRLLLQDSRTVAFTPAVRLDGVTTAGQPGHRMVIAARNGARPLIAAGGDVTLDLGARAVLVLEGLVISGAALVLPAAADNEPRTLILRHCTLLPGRRLQPDGVPAVPGAVSLRIEHPFASVRIEDSVLGAVQSHADAQIELHGSALDATASDAVAYEGLAAAAPGAELTLVDCTVVGRLHARVLALASNTLFHARLPSPPDPAWVAPVRVQRRQQGCVRFSWLPAGSVVPRRHRCVDDAADSAMRPLFTASRYGHPAYLQLAAITPRAIRQGADDEGEIGVMHPLAEPQRAANLRIRLDEYLRLGLAAGLFHAT
jgi:hypothetical protein